MKSATKLFTILYFILLLLHVYAGQWGIHRIDGALFSTLTQVTKPALLATLICWVAISTRQYGNSHFSTWLLIALIFSLIGDVLLMFQNLAAHWFTMGLGAFLIAHVAYIVSFTRTYRNDHHVALLRQQGWLLVLVVGYGVYFFSRLSPNLGSMLAPVMLYIVVIIVMMLLALNRFGKVSSRSFWKITLGAVLFIASDSILAVNKFVQPSGYSHVLIMGSYGMAQYFITAGGLQQMFDTHHKFAKEKSNTLI